MWLWIVLAIIAIISVIALIAFRRFRAYRYTDEWRKGPLRGAMLGMMVTLGGFFGYRLPPPPETNITFAAGKDPPSSRPPGTNPSSPGPPLAEDTPDEKA